MLRSGKWDAHAVMSGMADKVLRSLPPAADGKLFLIGDTTHKPKRGHTHPLGHVTRQSESSPYTFGFDMVVVVASWDRFRIPVAIAAIDPERKGHQNILFRQMLKDFEPPAWVTEVVVVADAGYPANATLQLLEELEWTYVVAMPRTRKFTNGKYAPSTSRMAGDKIIGSLCVTPSCISWAMSRSCYRKNGETLGRNA